MDLCRDIESLVTVDESVMDLGISIAYTVSWTSQSLIHFSRYPYEEDLTELFSYVKNSYTLENLKKHKIVRAYRDFFWKLGIDPTKTRPASEALVRRALRNQFPRINHVVDAGNIASAFTLVPVGLYDLDRARPPLTIKKSLGGEAFRPIGGKEEVLEKGLPILVDSRGVVMHIYPHRDSVETCVTEQTRKIAIIAAGVPGVEKSLLIKTVDMITQLLKKDRLDTL